MWLLTTTILQVSYTLKASAWQNEPILFTQQTHACRNVAVHVACYSIQQQHLNPKGSEALKTSGTLVAEDLQFRFGVPKTQNSRTPKPSKSKS